MALVALCALTTGAQAQASKIFVSSTGSDGNDGSRQAPKRSFQAAHDAVAAGGGIVVLDTAGYGTVTITKSVSIVVPPGVSGFITGTGYGVGDPDGIHIAASSTDVVSIRGLIVENAPTGASIASAGTVTFENCIFRNVSDGITGKGSFKIIATGDTIENVSFGVDLRAQGGGNLDAIFDGVAITNASAGFVVTNPNTTLTASHCSVSNASTAFAANYGGTILADECRISNSHYGVAFQFQLNAAITPVIATRGNNTIFNVGTPVKYGQLTPFAAH